MLAALLDALTSLGLASGVARSSVLYAAVSAAHVLGIGLLLAPIALVDLRLIGLVRELDEAALRLLRRTAMVGIALSILTGILLTSARPAEYADNPAFLAKLAIVALGIAHALIFEWRIRRLGLATVAEIGTGRASGAASLAFWLSALLLGRWIAFA